MDPQEETQVNTIINRLETELNETRKKLDQSQDSAVSNAFYSSQNENLIIFQLELDNILEKIEHLLRGDVIKTDKEGNLFYATSTDKDLKLLNEYGVQLIMNVISFYLNRNTILSNYEPERIDEICYDVGDEISDVILCNYEKMGMDTEQKKSRYPLMVLSIIHIIESTYKRALGSGERESLRSGRIVTQTDRMPSSMGMGYPQMQEKRNFKIFDPKTW